MEKKIQEIITEVVIDFLSTRKEDIKLNSRFTDDLGADSLDIVEIIMRAEEEFSIEIPDEEAEKLKTVSDAVEYVFKKLN